MKFIITGSIAFDYLMSFPGRFSDNFVEGKLDKISVSFLVDQLNKQQGGCAANIAYSLALLGESPVLLGAVGKDFGPYREFLKAAGVDTAGAKEFDDVFTASFFANTDMDKNQICSFYTGAMQYAGQLSVTDFADASSMVIVSPNDPAAMQKYPDACRQAGIPFIYDPGQQIARLSGEDLKAGAEGTRILIVNDYEYELFLKKTEMTGSDLLGLTETVIITLGDKGAKIVTRDNEHEIPVATPERIKDPTGVGDAFRAGLLKGLKFDLPWEVVGRLGSLAATYVIETDGPQSHSYDLNEFLERYEACFGPEEALGDLI